MILNIILLMLNIYCLIFQMGQFCLRSQSNPCQNNVVGQYTSGNHLPIWKYHEVGFLTRLTIITDFRNLPRVSYIKAIGNFYFNSSKFNGTLDVWMLSAMTFIFSSLIELAIVGYKVKDLDVAKKKPVICKKKVRQLIKALQLCVISKFQFEDIDNSPKGQLCNYEKRFMFPVERYQLAWRPSIFSCVRWSPDEIDRLSSIVFPATFALFNVSDY